MKKDIHPKYYPDAKVICACGNEITVGSTVQEIHTEVCSMCHPFYTGKQKLVDTAGRVEKFKARLSKKIETSKVRKGKKVKKEKAEKRKVTMKKIDESAPKKLAEKISK